MRRATPIHGRDHAIGGSDPIVALAPQMITIFGDMEIVSAGSLSTWNDSNWVTAPKLYPSSGAGVSTYEDNYFLWDAAGNTLELKRFGAVAYSIDYTAIGRNASTHAEIQAKDYDLQVAFGHGGAGDVYHYSPPATGAYASVEYNGHTNGCASRSAWNAAESGWTLRVKAGTSSYHPFVSISCNIVFWDAPEPPS